MAKPRLKRQGLLGQFTLGTDPIGAPVQNTVSLSSAYARSHQTSGLVLSGRSPRSFYHPVPHRGVIYQAPGITVYRWTDFGTFTTNVYSSFTNGITVDGIIPPTNVASGLVLEYKLANLTWQQIGVPAGKNMHSATITAETTIDAPLPQFVGFPTGGGTSRGYLLTLQAGIQVLGVQEYINYGQVGLMHNLGQYSTGVVNYSGTITFTFHSTPPIFDVVVQVQFGPGNARFNLRSLTFNMIHDL